MNLFNVNPNYTFNNRCFTRQLKICNLFLLLVLSLTACNINSIFKNNKPSINPERDLFYQVEILRINNELKKAIILYEDFLLSDPNNFKVRLNYAKTLANINQKEKAKSQYEKLNADRPSNKDVIFTLARFAMDEQEYIVAKTYLHQLDNTDQRAIFNLAKIAEINNQNSLAFNKYLKIQQGSIYYLNAQLRLASLTAKLESIDKARSRLHNIVAKSQEDEKIILEFEGNLLFEFGLYQESYDFFTLLLNTRIKDSRLLYYRSLSAERLGKIDVVISDLAYVIEQNPNNAKALNQLGYTLTNHSKKLPEALKLIQRARDLSPNNISILDSLGWVHYQLGNYKVSLNILSEAIKKENNAEIAAHYGEVLWVTGDKQKAVDVWNSIDIGDNNHSILKETKARFIQ